MRFFKSNLALRRCSGIASSMLMLSLSSIHGQDVLPRADQITLTPEESANFSRSLSVLSKQEKVAIVAEGMPLHRTLDRKPDAKPISGDFTTVLQELCRLYDYEIAPVKGASENRVVWELRKRYSQSYDLPDVTPKECTEALVDADKAIRPFLGDTTSSVQPIVDGAIRSISSDQQAQLMSSSGIKVKDLSADQQKSFFRVAMYFYFNDQLRVMDQSRDALSQLSGLSIVEGTIDGIKRLFVVHYDLRGKIRQPLFGYIQGVRRAALPPAKELPDLKEVALDNSGRTALGRIAPALLAGTVVQPSLLDRAILIAGAGYTSSANLARAIADVNGFRYSADRTGNRQIRRPILPEAPTLLGVYDSVKQILPLSAVNAASPPSQISALKDEVRALRAMDSTNTTAVSPMSARDRYMARKDARAQAMQLSDRCGQIIVECDRRLEFIYEFKAKDRPGAEMSLGELGPEAERYFALMILAGFLEVIDRVSIDGPPPYVAHFDDIGVVGGQSATERWVGLAVDGPGGKPRVVVRMSIPNS